MNIYGYCRVSTEQQLDGQSLGMQERTIQGYCIMYNLQLTRNFIEEGVSASIPFAERPQGKNILDSLEPGDVIITPKLDRMFRSSLDALTMLDYFQKEKVALHMLDLGGDVLSNGMGKLIFTILSAVAEAERDRIRERIRDVKKDQKARGMYLGGIVPYGFIKVGKQLIPHPEQQETIKFLKYYRSRGHTLRRLAQATGLSLACVHGILKRP